MNMYLFTAPISYSPVLRDAISSRRDMTFDAYAASVENKA